MSCLLPPDVSRGARNATGRKQRLAALAAEHFEQANSQAPRAARLPRVVGAS